MLKFFIGVALVTGGLALMAVANKQMIAAADCVDCEDDVTADIYIDENGADLPSIEVDPANRPSDD
jgi:hypothetical protein